MTKKNPQGFYACERGFRITFANGWSVSVQWSGNNYCRNSALPGGVEPMFCGDAEIMAIDPQGGMQPVRGWQTSDQVARYIYAIQCGRDMIAKKQP